MRRGDRIVPRGLAAEPAEGMARVIGTHGFKHDADSKLCWHCGGSRRCACVSCLWDADGDTRALAEKVRMGIVVHQDENGVAIPVYGRCMACMGTGLLTWPEVA